MANQIKIKTVYSEMADVQFDNAKNSLANENGSFQLIFPLLENEDTTANEQTDADIPVHEDFVELPVAAETENASEENPEQPVTTELDSHLPADSEPEVLQEDTVGIVQMPLLPHTIACILTMANLTNTSYYVIDAENAVYNPELISNNDAIQFADDIEDAPVAEINDDFYGTWFNWHNPPVTEIIDINIDPIVFDPIVIDPVFDDEFWTSDLYNEEYDGSWVFDADGDVTGDLIDTTPILIDDGVVVLDDNIDTLLIDDSETTEVPENDSSDSELTSTESSDVEEGIDGVVVLDDNDIVLVDDSEIKEVEEGIDVNLDDFYGTWFNWFNPDITEIVDIHIDPVVIEPILDDTITLPELYPVDIVIDDNSDEEDAPLLVDDGVVTDHFIDTEIVIDDGFIFNDNINLIQLDNTDLNSYFVDGSINFPHKIEPVVCDIRLFNGGDISLETGLIEIVGVPSICFDSSMA